MEKRYTSYIYHLFWFIIAFTFLIAIETLLVSLLTGYFPTKISFQLWDKFHFFLSYLLDAPFDTLSFVLIHKPIFKIEAIQDNLLTTIWGLHFYSYTLLTHIFIAILASRSIVKHSITISALHSFPINGAILLILSSLFLYLASCCTTGSNWIIHSALLSTAFNPVNATEASLDIYKNIREWFIWVQYLASASGICLIILKIKQNKTVS